MILIILHTRPHNINTLSPAYIDPRSTQYFSHRIHVYIILILSHAYIHHALPLLTNMEALSCIHN